MINGKKRRSEERSSHRQTVSDDRSSDHEIHSDERSSDREINSDEQSSDRQNDVDGRARNLIKRSAKLSHGKPSLDFLAPLTCLFGAQKSSEGRGNVK